MKKIILVLVFCLTVVIVWVSVTAKSDDSFPSSPESARAAIVSEMPDFCKTKSLTQSERAECSLHFDFYRTEKMGKWCNASRDKAREEDRPQPLIEKALCDDFYQSLKEGTHAYWEYKEGDQ